MKKLSEIRQGKPRFQLMPIGEFRRDSPFFVDIPEEIREARKDYMKTQMKKLSYKELAEQGLCWDIEEASLGIISTQHLEAIMKRWCENNKKDEIELDI